MKNNKNQKIFAKGIDYSKLIFKPSVFGDKEIPKKKK